MLHLYFAPLEGITTYPYRNLHHKYFGGVDKYFTPFLAPGPEQGMSVKEMRDVLPENNAGVPVVPQEQCIRTNSECGTVASPYGYWERRSSLLVKGIRRMSSRERRLSADTPASARRLA